MPSDQDILLRHLSTELQDALTYSRVVNIVGARQVGKTTLVRDILQTGRFISLDDEAVLEAIEEDPWGQLQRLTSELKDSPLIIDEAQRSGKLPLARSRELLISATERDSLFLPVPPTFSQHYMCPTLSQAAC